MIWSEMTLLTRRSILALAAALLAGRALAEARRLAGDEVRALLEGRWIEGTWSGTRYRQHFDAAGHTVYKAEGAPLDQGRWRVNAYTGTYESLWRMGGWTAYPIEADGNELFWIDGTGQRHPFRLLGD